VYCDNELRMSITIPDEQYNEIKSYCEQKEMKISGLLRLGAKRIIEENDRN